MTRIKTRLQTWSALAALSTITSLAIPAVSAWAEGSEPAASTLAGDQQRAASARPEAGTSVATPSFIFPEMKYLPGLGWEVDTGGPAVRIEHVSDD